MNNVYGTKKPALITNDDVEIFYHYRPSRSTDDANFPSFKRMDKTYLTQQSVDEDNNSFILPGMYNLRLPLEIFQKKGIYTIYIKPIEHIVNIRDVSTLTAYGNIKGVVIDSRDLGREDLGVSGALVGYRIEFFDDNNKRTQMFRIITSSNRCEPVSQSVRSSNNNATTYAYNENSKLLFCTVTPSTENYFNSNVKPYIGVKEQKIAIVNTKFNPFALEIEIVEHDDETISIMLEGDQLRNFDRGTITTFDSEGNIYNQVKTGTAIDPDNNMSYDFKFNNKDNIDFNENINDIKDSL